MGQKLSTLERRKQRVRRTLRKVANGRPRLCVFRSSKHVYAQVIDDENGRTIVAASSRDKDFLGEKGGNIEAAKIVGQAIAVRAKAANIENVIFDRGQYLYHGRVKALADAAREAGLNF